MSANSPHPVLTSANPAYPFTGTPGIDRKPIATSGTIGTDAIVKIQYRVRETDEWVDYGEITFATDQHINGYFFVPARYNRVVVIDPTGDTDVAVQL